LNIAGNIPDSWGCGGDYNLASTANAPAAMPDNLYRILQPSLRGFAGAPAWVCRGRGGRRVVAYGELHAAALTLAARMREGGVGGGDTVGIK